MCVCVLTDIVYVMLYVHKYRNLKLYEAHLTEGMRKILQREYDEERSIQDVVSDLRDINKLEHMAVSHLISQLSVLSRMCARLSVVFLFSSLLFSSLLFSL